MQKTPQWRTDNGDQWRTATELAAQFEPHTRVKEVRMKLATAFGMKEEMMNVYSVMRIQTNMHRVSSNELTK